MTTTTITAEDIISRYSDDIAFVAEQDRATDLSGFIDQLDIAARRFGDAGINNYEDLETAAIHLDEARWADDETSRDVFLRRAGELLEDVSDMTEDYRLMG
jgi:hypothetical protein